MRRGLLSSLLLLSLPTAVALAESPVVDEIADEEVLEEITEEGSAEDITANYDDDDYSDESEEYDDEEEEYDEEDDEGFDDEFADDDWGDEEESSFEISGFIKNETAFYLSDGNSHNDGEERTGENSHDSGDLMKFENSLDLFINYAISDSTNFHAQTNFIYDTQAIENYKGHRQNTQHDYLREFYVDTILGGVELRAGKQQLAWGTADGVKFLDIINPTDYREWGQNSMEDSRIPLWMLKAEIPVGESGMDTLQLVWVPDLELNQIPGLYDPETGDEDQPFVSLGAETMTGKYNGFYHIARDMGQTSTIFNTLLNMGGMRGLTGPMKYRTVEFFTGLQAESDGQSMTFADVQGLVQVSYDKLSGGITDADVSSTLLNSQNSANDEQYKFDADSITSCFGLDEGNTNPVDLNLLNNVFIPMLSQMGSGNNVLNAAANNGTGLFSNFQSYMTGMDMSQMAGATEEQAIAAMSAMDLSQIDSTSIMGQVRADMLNGQMTSDSVLTMLALGSMVLASHSGEETLQGRMYGQFTGFNSLISTLQTQMGSGDQEGATGTMQSMLGAMGITDAEQQGRVIYTMMMAGQESYDETQGMTAEDQQAMQTAVDNFLTYGLVSMMGDMNSMAENIFQDGTTNQFDGTLSVDNPTSAFDYMGNTAFGTFKYFQGMNTVYRKDHEEETIDNSNFGVRWKSSVGSSTNYSLNYYSHWDNNPYVELHWEDKDGRRLDTHFVTHDAVPMYDTASETFVPTDLNGDGTPDKVTALEKMTYQDGTEFSPTDEMGQVTNPATLVFTEKMNRIDSFGMAFDSTIDFPGLPVVLRGEFLYEAGVKTPVVDKLKLSYGDLAGALYMEEADFIKGVIGLDVTLFTNLFTSFQYMHVHNMDFVEETREYNGKSYEVYTANPATLSLSNNMKKAEEDQQMYTLFLSKPFLEGDVLRVNNLFLLEGEDGGFWNRFDMEYTYTDSLIFRAEYNVYGGDEYGIFGQFEDQSSIAIGAKYLF
jgi:hypothetical protein